MEIHSCQRVGHKVGHKVGHRVGHKVGHMVVIGGRVCEGVAKGLATRLPEGDLKVVNCKYTFLKTLLSGR